MRLQIFWLIKREERVSRTKYNVEFSFTIKRREEYYFTGLYLTVLCFR